jgi:hypothetical protein
MEKFKQKPLIFIIFFIGVFIRIFGYASSAIRYDEAISLQRATTPFIQYLLDQQLYSNLILWELILRLVAKISQSLWIIRLPSVIFGILTLCLVWKIISRLGFTNIQIMFTLIVVSLSPGIIWTSVDARPYGLLITLYLLSIVFIQEKKWLGLFATSALTLYTHAIGPCFGLGALIYALVNYPKKWKRILIIGAAVLLTWLPWFLLYFNIKPAPNFIYTFWLDPLTTERFLINFYQAYFIREVNWLILLIFLVTIILSIAIALVNSFRQPKHTFLIFFIPFLIILFESIFWKNTLFWRTILPFIIPFVIFLGQLLTFRPKKYLEWAVFFLWVILSLVGFLGWNPITRGGEVDKAANYIRSNWEEGDILYYATATVALPFDYYLDVNPKFLMDGISNVNLTPPTIHGFQFESLEEIPFHRAWVIYPRDRNLPLEQANRLASYIKTGELIALLKIFETSDIMVYLIPSINK